MKAEILFVTVGGLVALMFLGLLLVSTETASMGGAANATAYNTSATMITTLFVGAGGIWVALLVVIAMVVFYGLLKLAR
jgi:hypothetical protein